jgi:hypothetical protein
VRFDAEHRFQAPIPAVVALLADPDFYRGLALPDLSEPEVLEEANDGDHALLRLRYQYVGSLDPMAQRLLGAKRLTWIQLVRVDRSEGSGTLGFEAEKDPRRLHGSARFVLSEAADTTVRRIDGDLIVAVPGIGRMAERRIVSGLLHRLDIEAQALDDRLDHQE